MKHKDHFIKAANLGHISQILKKLGVGAGVAVTGGAVEKEAGEHVQRFIKSAGLGTLVGRGIAKGLGGFLKNRGVAVSEPFANVMMNPATHSAMGRTAIGAGAVGMGVPAATGAGGYAFGNRRGYNKGMDTGMYQGFNAGGQHALNMANEGLGDVYGGLGGRWNALLGGATPGNNFLEELRRYYGG